MSAKRLVAKNLAAAFLAGPWCLDGLVERGAAACGQRDRWIGTLARRVLTAFPAAPATADAAALERFIEETRAFRRAWSALRASGELPLRSIFCTVATMLPSPWPVPALPTPGTLAAWLGLTPGELDWFADSQGREARVPGGPLRHYSYHWLRRRSGRPRLLEVPKPRLKSVQRRILRDLLNHIPPHDAAHGYRRGRSVVSYVTPHAGRAVVLHFDLCDFFPSVRASRIHALFRAAGYPSAVDRLLTGLCTNVVPWDAWRTVPLPPIHPHAGHPGHFGSPHLPQGAPTPRPRQPLRVPAGLSLGRSSACSRGELHALRRRPDLFRRRIPGAVLPAVPGCRLPCRAG
jgi:hypothetical protein